MAATWFCFVSAVTVRVTGIPAIECVRHELPTVVTTRVLAALAEASELMPHLLP